MKTTKMGTTVNLASTRGATSLRTVTMLFVGAIFVGGLGCAATPACRKGPKDDVAAAARTTGEAVKTGATTGVEGIKAAGSAVGGWVEGGSDEAKEKWNEGKVDTKAKANEGAAKVDQEASVPTCKD